MKLVLITFFFGKYLPDYFKLFIRSLDGKPVDCLFFTNIESSMDLPDNVVHISMSIDELGKLISEKIGAEVPLTNPYKLCDIKPAFGLVFEDYIKEYDYWALSDFDIIFGDLSKVQDLLKADFDVISFAERFFATSFAILKNSEDVNRLFMRSKDWKYAFETNKYLGFDEVSRSANKSELLFQELINGAPLHKFNTEIECMTRILFYHQHGLNTSFKTRLLEMLGPNDIVKYASNSLFINKGSKNEFIPMDAMLYHIKFEKSRFFFRVPNWREIPETYFLTRIGIFNSVENFKLRRILRFMSFPLIVIQKIIKRIKKHF